MEPAIITLGGELTLSRYSEVHGVLEAAKTEKGRPLVIDLSTTDGIDPMVAAEIVLFVHRALRYDSTVVIVPPPHHSNWLTHAESIHDVTFCKTRDEALSSLRAKLA